MTKQFYRHVHYPVVLLSKETYLDVKIARLCTFSGSRTHKEMKESIAKNTNETISDSINHSCALSLRYPWMPLELPPKNWKVLVKGPLAFKKAKSLLSLVIKA